MDREEPLESVDRPSDVNWRAVVRTAGELDANRELARTLESLAFDAARLGENEPAAEIARIAVEVHRGLSERAGTSADPQTARALVGLGVHQYLSNHGSSTELVSEAARIYHELASGSPEAFAAREQAPSGLLSALDNSLREHVDRVAKRTEGVEPPERNCEWVAFLLARLRDLQTLDGI